MSSSLHIKRPAATDLRAVVAAARRRQYRDLAIALIPAVVASGYAVLLPRAPLAGRYMAAALGLGSTWLFARTGRITPQASTIYVSIRRYGAPLALALFAWALILEISAGHWDPLARTMAFATVAGGAGKAILARRPVPAHRRQP